MKAIIPLVFAALAMGAAAQAPQRVSPAVQLDLDGQGGQARVLFQHAIDSAPTAKDRAAAERDMAMSWAFSGNCPKTVEYENRVIAYWKTRAAAEPGNAFYQEGEMADEAARVCIDLGDLSTAAAMYRLGRDLGLKEPHLPLARKDLWEYRYEHALARLAARGGNHAAALQHVTAAEAVLARMKTDDPKLYQQQVGFLPYLNGYVAFYAGNFKAALADFQQDRRRDPFITCMIGLCFEKLGDLGQARAAYRQAAAAAAHNPPAAFARPFATKKLAELATPR